MLLGDGWYLAVSTNAGLTRTSKDWKYVDSTQPNSCEWTCYAGYLKDGNSCVEAQQTRTVACVSTNKPADNALGVIFGANDYDQSSNDGGKTFAPIKSQRTFSSGTTPGACEWSCERGYVRDGATLKCKKAKYQCTGTLPTGFVDKGAATSPSAGTIWAQRKTSGALNACEWRCRTGYTYNETRNSCVANPGTTTPNP